MCLHCARTGKPEMVYPAVFVLFIGTHFFYIRKSDSFTICGTPFMLREMPTMQARTEYLHVSFFANEILGAHGAKGRSSGSKRRTVILMMCKNKNDVCWLVKG